VAPDLRWLADAFEQAQRIRLDTGERIRAILQRRDHGGAAASHRIPGRPEVRHGANDVGLGSNGGSRSGRDGQRGEVADAESVLDGIRRGRIDGPVPLLGRTYRRHWEEERELRAAMTHALAHHPAWDWLSRVRGIGPTLACKLLARLDLARAPTPSSFWAYCGLATVPGVEYACGVCGRRISVPHQYQVRGRHNGIDARPCTGWLERCPATGVRVAQPKASAGMKSPYDMRAKKICYLIGVSFLRSGGLYAQLYHAERTRLARERPGWSPGRCHLAALRRIEKLFLSHLWEAWTRASGRLPIPPFIAARDPGTRLIPSDAVTHRTGAVAAVLSP
jgi:hypothetical protein